MELLSNFPLKKWKMQQPLTKLRNLMNNKKN